MLLLLCFIGTGCAKTLNGTLTIKTPITLNLNSSHEKTSLDLDKGTYHATVKINSKRILELQIGNNYFPFKIPENISISDIQGKLTVNAEDSEQPYDLSIELSRTYFDGPEQEGWESCDGSTSISRDPFKREGYRFVRYYNRTITKKYLFTLLNPENNEKTAYMRITRKHTYTIYLQNSTCF